MNTTSNKHITDILFVLSLFCVFAVSAVALIVLGADVYKKTITHMDANYTARTSVAFFSEKMRQGDCYDSIKIINKNGTDMLTFISNIDGNDYATYLYENDGYLYELFTHADIDLPLDAGQKIMELSDLSFTQILPSLYNVKFTDSEGQDISLFLSSHCSQ